MLDQLYQYLPYLILLLALVASWVLIRSLLRLTARVFSCGCLVLLGLGLLLLLYNSI